MPSIPVGSGPTPQGRPSRRVCLESSSPPALTPKDLEQISRLGIPAEEVERQLAFFSSPPPAPRLERPCRLDDGIHRLVPAAHEPLEAAWTAAAESGRLLKFVPASGAATRMFRDLQGQTSGATAQRGHFLDEIASFAFYPRLQERLAQNGLDLSELIRSGSAETVLDTLLEPGGLGYLDTPKALLDFHSYAGGARTSFEEHFVEATHYLATPGGTCRFHFTVTPRHTDRFTSVLDRLRRPLERSLGVVLEVGFSTQSDSTDTIAVDPENAPFRLEDDSLLFRPGGHGALLHNLGALGADIVFIKNIDNISPERRHQTVAAWKRLLAGYLVDLQGRAFELLELLETSPEDPGVVDRALELITTEFSLVPPPFLAAADHQSRHSWAVDRLDRPMRVCGVVIQAGEPGGGPFWVRETDGGLAGQIVESAQVDRSDPDQEKIWASSTHFNPTDLVCALRDRHGQPFDLSRFVDPTTAFISHKAYDGRPLKGLERPGLWNGSMAGWNTAFVEVPAETFTPVKTLFDLLRPEHPP
ncbi:MAG: DUF4301 family protein [Acidobacteria bacterium]|nr:MAG: DUF4301 family protein [Acidobacteriota bacterium]